MTAEVTRRMLLGWVMNLGIVKLLGLGSNGKDKQKVTITLHLDAELVKELQIAAESRNNISVEEYITETISCAVSDRSCEPKEEVAKDISIPGLDDCYLCGHSMKDNFHSVQAGDYNQTTPHTWEHSGRCRECNVCNS